MTERERHHSFRRSSLAATTLHPRASYGWLDTFSGESCRLAPISGCSRGWKRPSWASPRTAIQRHVRVVDAGPGTRSCRCHEISQDSTGIEGNAELRIMFQCTSDSNLGGQISTMAHGGTHSARPRRIGGSAFRRKARENSPFEAFRWLIAID